MRENEPSLDTSAADTSVAAPDLCDVPCFEAEVVQRVRLGRPDDAALEATRRVFALLADRNRLLILHALREAGELCVCDLAHILGVSVAATSHHLRRLFELDLVATRREGKLVHYSLSRPWIADLGGKVLEEIA
jgi:ArsR family transcriptional regulator, lead/cadmium/zinc/bismuth-responsive transcriptional repressor